MRRSPASAAAELPQHGAHPRVLDPNPAQARRVLRSFIEQVPGTGVPGTGAPGTTVPGTEPFGSARVGRVAELAELARDEIDDLLADVDGMVADPLDAAGDDEHAQAVLALLRRVAE